MQKIWPFSLNVLLFAGIAFVMPFLVLYYQSLGLTGAEIGLLTGVTPLITLFSAPLWTGLADATQRHRLLMGIAVLLGTVIIFLVPFSQDVSYVILLMILLSIFFAPVLSFADSGTMFMLAGQKEMYGRIRLGGTIGFGVASLIAGTLIQNYGLRFAFWGGALLFFGSFVVSQKLEYASLQGGEAPRGGIRILLGSPRWILFLVLAFAGGMAMAVMNNYFFSYMKELGAQENTMGLALAIGTISEVPIFFWGNRLLAKFGARALLTLSMVVTGVRLVAMSAAHTPELSLAIQGINGLTFAAMWLAGVSYAEENAPTGLNATAQGLFGAMVFGFGSAVGGFVGGLLLSGLGGRGMYFVLGAAVLAVVAIVTLIESRIPAERRTLPNEI